ncbi:MAG: M12 family metallo-peptidase [Planctomycetota bacterium]|nr:M12 family metallo-peptidase [Planctomycetota bacterium]
MQIHGVFLGLVLTLGIAGSEARPASAQQASFAPPVVDLEHLRPETDLVRIEIEGRSFLARRERAMATSGGFTWVGVLERPAEGFASFAVVDSELSGTVRVGREVAIVRGRAGTQARVEYVDPAAFATCAEPEPIPLTTPVTPPSASALAGPSTIDVMVVYTPLARATEGGTAAMEALIELALAETNQAYAQSGVLQQVRLVARHEVAYVESASIVTDLARMTIANDGWLDEIPALRDACGADAVALIIQTSQSCGVSNSLTNQGAGFAPYAFCVVARNCAAANLSLAHELGHVMGLAHDRDTATSKCARASVAGNSTQVAGASAQPSISRNGSFVAFASSAATLVNGDTNGLADVFVRDRGTLTTVRASVSSSGVQGDAAPVGAPSVGDGGFVVFASGATNLASGDTNGSIDVFVRDVQGGTTTRILPAAGSQANGDCFEPSISGADRWVVFTTRAANLGASATLTQVFRWDRLSGTSTLVSANASGQPAFGASGGAHISDDGRHVAFWSTASDLVANDQNGTTDVFVRDMTAGTTARASLSTVGLEIAGPCEPSCAISADGRWIAFASSAADVIAGDSNGATDLFVRDRVGALTLLASANPFGGTGNGPSSEGSAPSFSSDGRRVAFTSRADDLVGGDSNGTSDVFVRDLSSGTTERVSLSSSGAEIPGGGGDGSPVAIDSTGTRIAFASRAAVATVDTNGVSDVYVFDRGEPYPPGSSTYSYGYRTGDNAWRTIMAYAPGVRLPYFSNPGVAWQGQPLGVASPSPFAAEAWRALNDSAATVAGFRAEVVSAFCFGHGSATPCPCGNASLPDEHAGCLNSLGLAGRLAALGGASIGADTLVLRASGMPDSSALYFQGTAQQGAGAGSVFGDGLRCAGGSVRRLAVRTNAGNGSILPASGDPNLSTLGAIGSASTVHYQVWYRNSPAFCSASTFNLTNGLSVAWRP